MEEAGPKLTETCLYLRSNRTKDVCHHTQIFFFFLSSVFIAALFIPTPLGYFLYLHLKCFPLSTFPLQKGPISVPVSLPL